MGNINSGQHSTRRTTSCMQRLDVRLLQRQNALQEGRTTHWRWWREGGHTLHEASITLHESHVAINHACTGAKTTYQIKIERTPCTLGGHRIWWRCPAARCNRRVAILYGGKDSIFACRHCHHLNYKSQRETKSDRAIRKAEKLRERLGWQRGIAHGPQAKPHRMHWVTYQRSLYMYMRTEQTILRSIALRFSIPIPSNT